MKCRTLIAAASAVGLAAALLTTAPAQSAVGADTGSLREAVTVDGIRAHQAAFQAIADANGGNREASSVGYDESVDYVIDQMTVAGYDVSVQTFPFAYFEELSPAELEQVSPTPTTYVAETDFSSMSYSGSGDVTAAIEGVDLFLPPGAANSSTSGCEAADFAGFSAGSIALLQRGTCSFADKALNAEAAGAVGVIIFNEGQEGDRSTLLFGTLGGPASTIPVVGATFALGNDLAASPDGTTVRIAVDAISETRTSKNVIANTPGGRDDRVVVVGAHLDSVPEGPGINDNGSGSAAILETAIQMAELGIDPENRVRFAWWGAEESGLLGSEYYVANLTKREIKNIAVNLNFDMVGSPNFVRFVYDGNGDATGAAGPNGSARVESVFLDYFAGQGLPVEPTAFDGRSDYGPFIDVGIPAGGLFTGAEGIKTAEEAAVYGGVAGEQYDPCYHLACDTFDNNSNEALDQMSDAIAHSVLTFADTTSAVNGTARSSKSGTVDMAFKGSKATK